MKFIAMASERTGMEEDYKTAHEFGAVRLGENNLYIHKMLKTYYVPYTDIKRFFRRVMLVPAKMCCGKGELAVENLVVCTDAGEVAQVQLPGTKAAKLLVDELKKKAPDAECTSQAKPDAE